MEETKQDSTVKNTQEAAPVQSPPAPVTESLKEQQQASEPTSQTTPEAVNLITLTVKTPKEKETILIEADANVKQLKDAVGKKFAKTNEQLCLIFSGKILKEQDTLIHHGIKDGVTVHLVIKAGASTAPATAPTATPSAQEPPVNPAPAAANPFNLPFGGGGAGGLFGNLGNMGLGNSNFAEIQSQMQRQMMSDPNMMRSMLDNPMVQSLMSNPDVIREMMMGNPQMQSLVEVSSLF